MRHGSLFSGIGGFDLASEWMGWENVFHCEWNEFGKKVLHHYWPNAESFDDITKTDFTKYANTIDILTGGFPCQPYSSAGQRKGKEDERHLWPEMLRAIQEIKPKYIVGENVFGLLNWNGGMVFDEVHSDLESAGYEVQAVVIPAAAVNAPHGRDRVWFVATNTNCNERWNLCRQKSGKWGSKKKYNRFTNNGSDGDASNTMSTGLFRSYKTWQKNFINGESAVLWRGTTRYDYKIDQGDVANTNLSGCEAKGEQPKPTTQNKRIEHLRSGWEQFPTQSPICGGDDGLPTELDGITFSKWRNESIKAYGNAIVPQVAYEIFKAIEATIQGVD
jgi:DNA (cytosine-5)-methyltransferase 1